MLGAVTRPAPGLVIVILIVIALLVAAAFARQAIGLGGIEAALDAGRAEEPVATSNRRSESRQAELTRPGATHLLEAGKVPALRKVTALLGLARLEATLDAREEDASAVRLFRQRQTAATAVEAGGALDAVRLAQAEEGRARSKNPPTEALCSQPEKPGQPVQASGARGHARPNEEECVFPSAAFVAGSLAAVASAGSFFCWLPRLSRVLAGGLRRLGRLDGGDCLLFHGLAGLFPGLETAVEVDDGLEAELLEGL